MPYQPALRTFLLEKCAKDLVFQGEPVILPSEIKIIAIPYWQHWTLEREIGARLMI